MLTSPAHAAVIEFLYVNANEGSASGGHTAIKFDRDVFHFQHSPSGLLCIYRNDFAGFEFAYALRENRTIHAHRIDVAPEVFQAIQEAFNQRLLIQNQQLGLRQALQDDLDLLVALKNPVTGNSVDLKALGYFMKAYQPMKKGINPPNAKHVTSPLLAQLQEQIRAQFGVNYLPDKRRRVWERLQKLKPNVLRNDISNIDPDQFSTNQISFAQAYKHELLNLAAIDVLVSGTAPDPDTFLKLQLTEFKLHTQQLSLLRQLRDNQYTELLNLLNSERPDWGYPMLVALARLQALDTSIQQGYLVVLDRTKQISDTDETQLDANDLPAALQYTQNILTSVHNKLGSTTELTERGYAEIERSVAAITQLKELTQTRGIVNLKALTSTPAMPAKSDLVPLQLSNEVLDEYRQATEFHLTSYQDKLQALYGYNLFNRNCVTEIFSIINKVTTGLDDESKSPLGGHIDSTWLNFIPFIAFDQVGNNYRVHSSYEVPAFRERQMVKKYLTQPEWLVDVQESNTISSSIYHWNEDDAAFLFFTQDASWQRPFLGSFNFATAIGQMVYGMGSWPWDMGRNWQKGIKGMLVSIPELLFFNIRKGSFPYTLPTMSVPTEK